MGEAVVNYGLLEKRYGKGDGVVAEERGSGWIEKLNRLSLRDFGDLFAAAAIYDLQGTYRSAFVGPGWLRAAAGPAIAAGGLGQWWGKRIAADGQATNLVWRDGTLKPRLAMRLIQTRSVLDGKPVLALIYGAENRFPWPYVVDELRALDPLTFLGMTHINAGALRKLAFPFLLQYEELVDGL